MMQKKPFLAVPSHNPQSKSSAQNVLSVTLVFLIFSSLVSCDRKPPEEPARAFFARDFGAVPGDEQSDGVAVRKCIQAAAACGEKAEVVFEAGNYRIDPAPGATAMGEMVSLPINKAQNLTLRGAGEGTALVFTNPSASGIVLEGCRNVILKNIQIDYDPLPYAFGTIRAVNLAENTFDLELDPDSPDFANPLFAKAKALWGMIIRQDPKQGTTRYGPVAVGSKVFAPVSGRVWRLTETGLGGAGHPNALALSRMKPGERYVHMARTYGSAVGIQSSSDVRIEGVTIFSAPGLSFFPYLSRGVSLVDCHVSPGPNRIISTNADGIHARGMRGDLLIERCSFEGMADDAINVHSSPIVVGKVNSPSEISAPPHTWSVRPGDELVAYDGVTLSEKGRTIVESSRQTGSGILIRFAKPLEGLRAGKDYTSADRLYNLSEAGGPFVIRDCRFLAHRGRAILVSAINGTIEDNVFENNEGAGVVLDFGDAIWAEGPPARGIRIVGNAFLGKGGHAAAIFARRAGAPSSRCFSNLLIENNRFVDLSAPAVRLSGVEGALIENNTIFAKTAAAGSVTFPAVELENSAGIVIGNMDIQDTRFKTGVVIGRNVEPGEKGVRIGRSDKALPVIDRRVAPAPTAP